MTQLLKLAKTLNKSCKYMQWFLKGGYIEDISYKKVETF